MKKLKYFDVACRKCHNNVKMKASGEAQISEEEPEFSDRNRTAITNVTGISYPGKFGRKLLYKDKLDFKNSNAFCPLIQSMFSVQ